MELEQAKELLLQSLEHERGGVKVYEAALDCVINEDLKEEFENYHKQTRRHVEILEQVLTDLDLDPEEMTPGRGIVRDLGASLVKAMKTAAKAGKPEEAEIVACECVVLAETKDHLDWELIGEACKNLGSDEAEILQPAYDEVEEQEDEHLYHSRGWCRELWLQSMGIEAELPPPEETREVKTEMEAARVQQQRLKKKSR
jgi:rubrerythrin